MADADDLAEFKESHPNAAVVCYINSSTEVKALCDVCVTSSNALKIIKNIDKEEIIFLPDKNLGAYLQEQVPEKKMILWNGFCITHRKVRPENVLKTRELIPDIKILAHPECEKEVRDLADFLGSTGEIIDYATKHDFKNYLIVTEEGVIHELKKRNPGKNFYVPGNTMTCVNMKKTRLEDVLFSLENMKHQIQIDEAIRLKAYNSLMKMHEMAR
jgi:quinolinate synthase